MKYEKTCSSVGNWGLILTRVVVGAIFIMAGIGKLFGPTPGIEGFSGMLAGIGFPIPIVFAILVGVVELVGGVLLIVGFLDNWAAMLLAFIILVAILTVHLQLGWKEVRYPLLLFTVLLSYVGTKFSWKKAVRQ